MPFTQYVYISDAKIDTFYPQLGSDLPEGSAVKAGVNVGIFKLEVERHGVDPSQLAKLARIIKHVHRSGELGSIEAPKRFFKGSFDAICVSIKDWDQVFLGGMCEIAGQRIYVGLTGSREHMIGPSARIQSLGDYDLRYRLKIEMEPPGGKHPERLDLIEERTNRVAADIADSGMSCWPEFSYPLARIWLKHNDFVAAEYQYERERELRVRELQPTDTDRDVISSWQVFNPLVRFMLRSPPGSSSALIRRVMKSLLSRLMGESLLQKKSEVIPKLDLLAKLRDTSVEQVLQYEDRALLHTIRGIIKAETATRRRYEFVAMNLIQGEILGDRVLLGSPLYVAEAPSPMRG
jgi:hypothetical protein